MSDRDIEADAVPAEPGEVLEVAEVRALDPFGPTPPPPLPAQRFPVDARGAAMAATGFVAGVATLAVVRRRSARRLVRRRRKARGAAELLPIVGSRSFLVDVHLIGRD